jgi:SAM-dependent methyltransferase
MERSNPIVTIEKELETYYAVRQQQESTRARQVGWKSSEAQHNRFQQLVKVIDTSTPFSVNDFGCGLGDFFDYLTPLTVQHFSYLGYDMIPDMVASATSLHPQPNARFLHLTKASQMQASDYTVASGVFNIRFSLTDAEWQHYILETLSVINDKSTKGFSFNALTTYSDKELMRPELYYSDPLFIFDFCKRNFSQNVALLHDYREYDFTIIVRKA